MRLREKGYNVGLISEEQYQRLNQKKEAISKLIEDLKILKVKPNENINNVLAKYNSSPISIGMSLETLIKRPEVNASCILDLVEAQGLEMNINYSKPNEILEQALIHYKYSGYISKALEQANKMRSYESRIIPDDINYDLVDNIALEAREKLKKIRPKTIGQASRISGVNPADISVLVVYVEKMIRR